jgi:hypothetical protein
MLEGSLFFGQDRAGGIEIHGGREGARNRPLFPEIYAAVVKKKNIHEGRLHKV